LNEAARLTKTRNGLFAHEGSNNITATGNKIKQKNPVCGESPAFSAKHAPIQAT
jgi:hypothetical protein